MLAISMHELYFIPILPDRKKIENLFYLCFIFNFKPIIKQDRTRCSILLLFYHNKLKNSL